MPSTTCQFEYTDIKDLYRCKFCGFEHAESFNHKPDQIHRTCPKKQQKPKRPTTSTKIINLAKATAKFVADKGKTVSPANYEVRLKECNNCVYHEDNRCELCGCNLTVKAKWRQEKCPLGKWPHYKRDIKEMAAGEILYYKEYMPARLGDCYKNAHCFFIGAGPSLRLQTESGQLDFLQKRGIISCAVNNVAATLVKPTLWVSVDEPKSFCANIWRDPSIMKFVAEENYNKRFIEFIDGKKVASTSLVSELPCVWYFPRNNDFNTNTFLTANSVNWGNHTDVVDQYGNKGGRSVMLAALRIMYHLGIRRVYLLGCDFSMVEGNCYAFPQQKHKGGCATNNQMYRMMNERLTHLRPVFEKANFHIYNCTPDSKLTAFDKISLDEAVKRALKGFPDKVSTEGMYG